METPKQETSEVEPTKQTMSATIEAIVTRADGTVEHLGVVASTEEGTIVIAESKKD